MRELWGEVRLSNVIESGGGGLEKEISLHSW